MALLLAHEGHQVLRANDAGAALELLSSDQTGRPDVLLVDLQMPGVSGGQLAEKVRATGQPRTPPVGHERFRSPAAAITCFRWFLLKPLAMGDLRRALKPKKAGPHTRHPGRPSGKTGRGPTAMEALDMAVVGKLLKMMPVQALLDIFAACIADTRAVSVLSRTRLTGKRTGSARWPTVSKAQRPWSEPAGSPSSPPDSKRGVARKRPPLAFWTIY